MSRIHPPPKTHGEESSIVVQLKRTISRPLPKEDTEPYLSPQSQGTRAGCWQSLCRKETVRLCPHPWGEHRVARTGYRSVSLSARSNKAAPGPTGRGTEDRLGQWQQMVCASAGSKGLHGLQGR